MAAPFIRWPFAYMALEMPYHSETPTYYIAFVETNTIIENGSDSARHCRACRTLLPGWTMGNASQAG